MKIFAVIVCAAALVACSKSSPPPAPAAAATTAPIAGGTICDRKLLTPADIGNLLGSPITGTKPLNGDAQSCYFTTSDGNELMTSLRIGVGKATIATFTSGHMNDYAQWSPLGGVGDEAVWLAGLHEVDARKDDVLCIVQPGAMSVMSMKSDESTQQKTLGALCNTVFARLDAQKK